MSKIAIVGCDASGKTVLISSLSDYYKAGGRAGQSCIMVPADGTTRRYTDNLHRVMRINGEWPEATSDISAGTSLKWKMMRNGKEIADLELLDFGGENFRYAFRDDGTEKNPEVVARLKEYISGADFIVITVSMDKMLRNLTPAIYRELENGDIEYDRDSEAQWVTDGLIRMIPSKLATDPPGVVVALTQADKHRKELEEHGGAKALFAKCWPTIAAMYPGLNVVPCASIDRMSDDGLPADGYSTDGVLAVMKEFSRYAFGDCDDLCRHLDELQSSLTKLDEVESAREFLSAVADYRKTLDALGDKTAIVGELFTEKIGQFENFLENIRSREMLAEKAESARQRTEDEQKAAQEQAAAEVAVRADEADRPRTDSLRRIGYAARIAVLLAILVAVIGYGLKMLSQPPTAEPSPEAVAQTNATAQAEAAKRAAEEKAKREAEEAAKRAAEEKAKREAEEAAKRAAEEKAKQAAEAAAKEAAAAAKKAAEEKAKREAEAAARAHEEELAREKAEQERLRLENERIKAEQARAREEALRQARAREEALRKEHERKVQEAEEARKRAEAEMQKAKEAAREAELARARLEGQSEAAAKPAGTAKPVVTHEEALRIRAEERELKYQELREHQRIERERSETAGLMTSLVESVNGAHLERGRNLIAELSGNRKLTQGQKELLEYARTYMDRLEKAQNGNADDMLWVGSQYYTAKNSLGIVKNPREAFGWYQKAAAGGSAQAYFFMSLMTEQGEGHKQDEALSGRFCLKAARLGCPEAMFWTGVYFDEGTHGFEKSPATAYKFLSMAHSSGFENANLEKMIRRLQDESGDDTIDECFPEDPLLPPVKQEPKEQKSKKHWWGLGMF